MSIHQAIYDKLYSNYTKIQLTFVKYPVFLNFSHTNMRAHVYRYISLCKCSKIFQLEHIKYSNSIGLENNYNINQKSIEKLFSTNLINDMTSYQYKNNHFSMHSG